ncbi:biotin transporter BioY [Streptomyces sp. OE57]|uniref:biotin transporter BioY n=1 Tax=Streptomyces lacaronensis TaxID=3379885 RepID=UPI0039B74F92
MSQPHQPHQLDQRAHQPIMTRQASAVLLREAGIALAAAAAVGASAQIAVPLPGTPVPMTLQTLAVLLTGITLGWARAGASLALYVAAGFAGVPWFAEHAAGNPGASAGYLLGAIPAAMIAGLLSVRLEGRSVVGRVAPLLAGSAMIYAIGVPVLMTVTGANLAEGVAMGVTPFLLGDTIKLVAAFAAAPLAMKAAGRFARRH